MQQTNDGTRKVALKLIDCFKLSRVNTWGKAQLLGLCELRTPIPRKGSGSTTIFRYLLTG